MNTRIFLCACLVIPILWACAAEVAPPSPAIALDLPAKDYSYGYWLNGWRKSADDPSPDILCFETGYYGFAMDIAALDKPKFAILADETDYLGCLEAGTTRLEKLAPASLNVELSHAGKTYRLVSCAAARTKGAGHLKTVRMWESGKWVQHYDIQDLIFQDGSGTRLGCYGTLDLAAWPHSLSFNAELTPSPMYADGPNEGVAGNGLCVIHKPLDIPHDPGIDPETLTVECWVKLPAPLATDNHGWMLCKNSNEYRDGNYGFTLSGTSVGATLNIGGGRENQYATKARPRLLPDAWNHLALTYDGKALQFFLNGALQESKEINQKRVAGTGLLRIGGRADGHGEPVRALYDQVRIWNRALSAADIRAHAANPAEVQDRQGIVLDEVFESGGGDGFTAPSWTDATLQVTFKTGERSWRNETVVAGIWKSGEKHRVTVNCNFDNRATERKGLSVQVRTADNQSFPVAVDPARNCYVARIKGLKRAWAGGYTDVRNYDEFRIDLENKTGAATSVPLLIDLIGTGGITGLCPMLCDETGAPSAIPVQLSKNWHYGPIGEYLRAYMQVPAVPGISQYRLRISYGFYGTLPSASHSQLCLIGYGGNGRWDQLAIGCWGETFCLDMDMSLVDVSITDVRCLMVRKGLAGAKWSWTDGGWGGDWLGAQDSKGQKLSFNGLKTAYLAHGPCLTDVRYTGHYGAGREVDLKATVRTLRTDDHARTFHTLAYTFQKDLATAKSWLFKQGRTGGLSTPKIAYGNGKGLIAERDVPGDLKPDELFIDRLPLEGEGPWWVAFPGAEHKEPSLPFGSRALIIRSYKASFGGKTCTVPAISLPAFAPGNLDLLLVPPRDVTAYKAGDRVELDLEWITLPRTADDYYGPNETFRRHLTENPRSWKTVFREAKGNDLTLEVSGGTLVNTYPVIIQATKPEVVVKIKGGVGYVPVRFEKLPTAKGWALYRTDGGQPVKLDQSVHSNDYWQTDYDARSRTFRLTFNLPLDGQETSTWVLEQEY